MGRMKGRSAVLGVAVLMVALAACGPTVTPQGPEVGDGAPSIKEHSILAPRLEPPPIQAEDRGIEAVLIDGVWVFQNRPEWVWLALGGGIPEIVDGCLYLGDTVVVWSVNRIDQAAGAIAAARAGETPFVRIGGGVVNNEAGIGFPTVITDRCATSRLWIIGVWNYARNAVGGWEEE